MVILRGEIKMKLFKNYKKLYETELNNRKLYEEQYKTIYEENIDFQKEIQCYKEKCGKLSIELEDTKKFLEMEKQCSNALRKERKELKRKLTILKKEINNE